MTLVLLGSLSAFMILLTVGLTGLAAGLTPGIATVAEGATPVNPGIIVVCT